MRPEITAIAASGSRARSDVRADGHSDLDLYLFTRTEIPLPDRQAIVARLGGASRLELDQRFWGLSDQWRDEASGLFVDLNFFDAGWMEEAVLRVVERHQAALGYTTCFWRTVRQARLLADREGWLAGLQRRVDVAYPEPLRQNIVALNHPVLRGIITSYSAQLAKATARGDAVSLNHRVAALLASYFDCLFAANRVLHPGEKRLVELAVASCRWCPKGFAEDLPALFRAAAVAPEELGARVTTLLDRLDDALRASGLALPTA